MREREREREREPVVTCKVYTSKSAEDEFENLRRTATRYSEAATISATIKRIHLDNPTLTFDTIIPGSSAFFGQFFGQLHHVWRIDRNADCPLLEIRIRHNSVCTGVFIAKLPLSEKIKAIIEGDNCLIGVLNLFISDLHDYVEKAFEELSSVRPWIEHNRRLMEAKEGSK